MNHSPSPELAVIIVSWNTRDLTLDAIRTLLADVEQRGPDAAVWVVDNDSSDGSAQAVRQEYPQVHLIESDTNLGFGGGNNRALRAMGFGQTGIPRGDESRLPQAVYLLNSDTRTRPGATRALYDTLISVPRCGVVGARLAYEDGTFQHSAFRFPGISQLLIDLFPLFSRFYDTALNGRYAQSLYNGTEPFAVDHTLGATMMLRREVIQQTGLFDEQYFMYCEEIDWSMRIRRAGWEILCVPTARVTHLEGRSTRQTRPDSIINLWHSRLRFFRTYYARPKYWLTRAIIRLGMRRKLSATQRAYQKGEMKEDECRQLIAAYRTVQKL